MAVGYWLSQRLVAKDCWLVDGFRKCFFLQMASNGSGFGKGIKGQRPEIFAVANSKIQTFS